MKQSITDRYNAKYENVLTITGASESIQSIMEYKCTVNNELGSSEPKSIGLTGKQNLVYLLVYNAVVLSL